jgi:hypothetical protein
VPIRGAVQGIVLLYVLLRNGNEEESDERKSRTSGITIITSITIEPVIAITVFTTVTWTPETSRFSDDLSLVFGLPLLMTGSLLLIGQ